MTQPAKHTPGPWVVQRHDPNNSRYHSNVVRNWSENGKHYTRSITIQLAYDEPAVNDANANLIAAAPAMYEALKGLLALQLDCDGIAVQLTEYHCHQVRAAQAALAQADGKQ